MAEVHDFDREVIAVLAQEPEVQDAVESLRSRGFEVEVLEGEEGRLHLDPSGDRRGGATVFKRFIDLFGDEQRILEELDRALAEGKRVVSVHADEDRAPEVARILKQHGGHYVWRFGRWTRQKLGD